MIMQGNTPRSLTWPGCLAVVALGLTLLPMMPSLHGEPPNKEEARKSIEQAEIAIEKAKAALEHQKAVLEAKKAELEHATQRLRDESLKEALELRKAEEHQARIIRVERKGAYRIEIVLPADGSVNQKEILEKIRKVLPEKLRSKVVLHPVPATAYRLQIGGEEPRASIPGQPPRPQSPPRAQPPVTHGPKDIDINVRRPASSEKRINDLEKKLEKVLRELQELRKQIGHNPPPPVPVPPGFAPTAPASPVPPAGALPAPGSPPSANGPQGRYRLLIKPPAGSGSPSTTPGNP